MRMMGEADRESTSQAPAAGPTRANGPKPTRGFLFADLRDYTRFVETNGADAAAELLGRYRDLVRHAVSRFDGSEIKTEGDSFYVVFPAVSSAVECGLAIVGGAEDAVAESGPPIRVGVGVHAGETVETAEGYVGGAVNIAARICSQAHAGEVLVSDTVRALTQTVLPVVFEPRGRRQLKGVAEPIALYAAIPKERARAAVPVLRRRRTWVIAAISGLIAVVVLAGAAYMLAPKGLPTGPWKIGVNLPVSGDVAFVGEPQVNAVKLAIDEANKAGGIGGSQVEMNVIDDTGTNGKDTAPAAAAANAFVADPRVLAFISPRSSPHTQAQIPITNPAGLLECSSANTLPGLTKPGYGAGQLRSAAPSKINFIRLIASDDIQGPAAASFTFNDLNARNALVIDDTTVGTRNVADAFEAKFQELGGQTTRRALNPDLTDTDVVSALSPLTTSPATGRIDVVYFGGFGDSGAVPLRIEMASLGFGEVPLVSWDGLLDGSGTDDGSYINGAGAAAANTYVTEATDPPESETFDQNYRAAYGADPDPYSGAAYACAQIVLDALRAIAGSGPSADNLREAVRAYAVDPQHSFDTALGPVRFDQNGDALQQFVTVHRVEMGADGGKGDWVIEKQRDYGPAPP
jgi:branched-chain amino acid transport system substrate-binding protein